MDDLFLQFLQLIDITGKDQDESMIALHDCNGDVNRAINVLLEGSPDTVSIYFVRLRNGSTEIVARLLYLVIMAWKYFAYKIITRGRYPSPTSAGIQQGFRP